MGKKAKNKQAALSEDMFAATQEQLERYNDEQATQRELLNEQKDKYRQFEFKNPYADMKNQFAGMENFYEDMQVDMRAANFQKEQGQQQRANIMQTLRGSAGSSGVAGLAQAMANQGQLQTQQISASIGQQESMNQRLLAQGAGREQDLERQAELQIAQGEQYADAQRRAGAEVSRGLEYSKTGTLLGMSQQRLGAANQARAQAKAQQMGAIGDIASAGLSFATAGMKMGVPGGGGGSAVKNLTGNGYLDLAEEARKNSLASNVIQNSLD